MTAEQLVVLAGVALVAFVVLAMTLAQRRTMKRAGSRSSPAAARSVKRSRRRRH